MLWWTIAIVVGYIAGQWTTKKTPVPNAGPHTYNLRTFEAPRMSGLPLRAVAVLLDIPVLGHLLTYLLFRNNMFHTLRSLELVCSPTFFPLVHDFNKDSEIDHTTKLTPTEFLQQALAHVGQESSSQGQVFASIDDYARAYKSGKVLPSEIAQKVIAAIKESDAREIPLRYVIALQEDDVLKQARESDARIKAGKPLSIFDGVPISIKDEFDVKGYPTTCGTAIYSAVAVEDAAVAHRLREQGAILIGKTNMVEIGISTKGVNPHYGSPRNPYNIRHHTGGSSSGSAGAVGSGLFPITVGADGGGSIRVPAGLCGAVGLKPTFGRVSEHGCFPLCWTVAHAGPIASNVRDCALGYAVLAGVDPQDPQTTLQPPVILPNFDLLTSQPAPLKGLRIGVYSQWFDHAAPEVVKSCRAAVDILSSLGGEIVEIPVLEGLLEYARLSHTTTILTEMGSSVAAYFDNPTRSKFGYDSRLTLTVTKLLTSRDYLQANRLRTLAIASVKKLFESVDILVTPTTAETASRINTPDGKEDVDVTMEALMMRFVFLGNFTGIPGISVPCGYTPEGLPIGFQIMGRWWEEHVLLKVAHVLEQRIDKRAPAQLFSHL